MEEQHRLGRDVFIALAAVGWADGHLDQEEADAIVRTALDEGLELDEINEIEQATKEPVTIGAIDLSALSKEDRLFVYAVATWMTRLDGKVEDSERSALDELGAALKVPEGPRQHVERMAFEIAELPEDDRPLRYDLPKLRRIIGEKLRASRERRAKSPSGS